MSDGASEGSSDGEIRGGARGDGGGPGSGTGAPGSGPGGLEPRGARDRLRRLMEEFRRRQRECPDLVVRPWWVADGTGSRAAVGFVVEYCPRGVESAELAIRRDRVRVEGPGGVREARLELETGWLLDGEDRHSPETVANHLLSMADRLLEEAA